MRSHGGASRETRWTLPALDGLWGWMELVFDQMVSRVVQADLMSGSSLGDTGFRRSLSPVKATEAASGDTPSSAGVAELDDDYVKLVGYSVVSLRRGRERYVKGGSEVVARRMTREAFISWMIARNIDSIEPGEEPFLRVHFTVARRWPREPLEAEERQLQALAGIRKALSWGGEWQTPSSEERT